MDHGEWDVDHPDVVFGGEIGREHHGANHDPDDNGSGGKEVPTGQYSEGCEKPVQHVPGLIGWARRVIKPCAHVNRLV